MKGKQLALVLILLVALGGVALFLNRRNEASWSSSSTTASDARILDFPLNDVSQLTIQGNGVELNLARKEGGWKVKERSDFPASFDLVSGLIRKMWELKAVQDVKIGPSQLGRLQLLDPGSDPNSGTLLDLKGDGGKRISALLLGKKYLKKSDESLDQGSGFPAGRYVRKVDGSNRVALVSEPLDEVETKPEHWLSHDFIKIENPKSITLAGATTDRNWRLVRDSAAGPWKLLDAKPGEELDNAKASGLATIFANATFADVMAPEAKPTDTGLDKPVTATIETFDGFVYTVRFGKLMIDNYPVLVSVTATLPKERTPGKDEKPEDKTKLDQEFQTKQAQLNEKLAKEQKIENRPYLITKATIEQFMKDRSALMAEKKPSPSPASISPPGVKGILPPKPPIAPLPAGTPLPPPPRRPPK